MAKVTPNPLIESISGRACKTSNTYFATNKQTGKIYAAKLCNPYQGDPSVAQSQHRAQFAAKSKLVSAWMTANKPSTTNPKGTEAYQSVLAAYKAQHKIGNIFAFVSKNMDEDGKLLITTASGE